MADNEDSDNVFTKLDSLRSQQKQTTPTSGSAAPDAAPPEEDNVFKRLDAARSKREKIESGELPPENREPGYIEDIGRSTIAGLGRGTASLVGLPGDVEQLGRAGINLGARTLGYDDVVGDEAALPTSQSMSKLAEEYIPGASYKAKTTAGKFAQTMSEFAPTALTAFVPGLGGVKAGTALKGALASGALSEAAGQIAPEQFEGVARLAGALAGPAAFSKIVSPTAGTIATKVGLGSAAEKVGVTTPKTGAMRDLAGKAAENIEQGKGGLSKEATDLIQKAEQNLNLPKGALSSSADIVGSNPTEIINDLIGPSASTNAKFKDDIVNVINNVNTKREDTQKAIISYIKPEIDDTIKNAQNAYLKETGLTGGLQKGFSDTREVANQFKDTAWGDIVGSVLDNNKNFTSRQLETLLDRPAAKSAVQNALDGIENATGKKPNFLTYDKKTKAFSVTGPVPLEFWHNLKSELFGSQAIGAKNVAKNIEKEIGYVFKKSGRQNEYELANQNYSKFARLGERESVFDDGRKFVDALGYAKDAPEKQNILRQWSTAMSPAQKDMYQAGFMTRLLDDFGQGKAGIDKWQEVFSDPQYSKIAENILNHRPPGAPALAAGQPTNYDKMRAAYEVMSQASKVDQFKFISSPPVWTKFTRFLPNSVKNAAIGAGFPLGVGAALPNVVEDLALYGPNFAAMSLIGGTAGMLQGIYKNAKTREILRILNDQDPAEMQKLMGEIAKAKKVPQSMRQVEKFYDVTNENIRRMWVERLARTSAAGIGTPELGQEFNTEYQYKNGGRVTYKSGGKVSKKMLKKAEKMGRNGDTILAHINKAEAAYLKRMGGSGKINPKTGLREFAGADESGSSVTSSNYGGSSSSSMDTSSDSGFDSSNWGGGGGGMLSSDRPSYSSSGGGDWKPSTGGDGGGSRNSGLNDSVFGNSDRFSPMLGIQNGAYMGNGMSPSNFAKSPFSSQEHMLKAMGVEGSPTPGVVGGVASPGNVAETGLAATSGAGAGMAAAKAAAEAGTRSTPSSGVLSNEARLGPDQAMAPATGDWKQNPPSLAEPNQGADWGKLFDPIVSGVKDIWNSIGAPDPSLQAKPIIELAPGEIGGYKGNLNPNKIQDRAPGSPNLTNAANVSGSGVFPSNSALMASASPSEQTESAAPQISTGQQTGLIPPAETGLTGFESALGTTPTYAVDPNSYQNFKVDPEAAYSDLKSQLGWKSMFAPSQEDFTKQITDKLTASGSSYDPATGVVSATDPYTMKTLMSNKLPIENEGEVVATLNPSQFAKMVDTPEMRVPMPPSRDASQIAASEPSSDEDYNLAQVLGGSGDYLGQVQSAPAEQIAMAKAAPNWPYTPTPSTARASEPAPSEEYSFREDTIPKAIVNNKPVPTISEFEGSDQGPFTPRGDGQSSTRSQTKYGQGGQPIYFMDGKWVDSEGNVYEGDVYDTPMNSQLGSANGGAIRFPQGRVGRATGGRIPDTDKVFKAAKKALDGHTKQYMNLPDDDIVHALRIAKGYA